LTNAAAPLMLYICYKAFHIASLMTDGAEQQRQRAREHRAMSTCVWHLIGCTLCGIWYISTELAKSRRH